VRLQSIKLSGFKSFAEPTHFTLPGQLVGVVGPNGCGKSNIMDAVRWVLGESKASELRGESMQDVIFNGTTSRKPASRASVELTFDNHDHRAGGQWNQFTEIAVKRVLTRDGTSSYYINNQVVRRRDVQDVFLGTGLGPRAYAIIGQGTISRIIESRPEELRLFLEEAAGVSKYKERRRETENRLEDTRENLTRVEDIQRELGSQLEKLEKQAEVAATYHTLQAQATLRQQQLWFLKRAEAQAEQERVRVEGLQTVNALQERTAELRHTEAQLELLRQAHYDAGDAVNQAQAKLYEASAEVGKLEARTWTRKSRLPSWRPSWKSTPCASPSCTKRCSRPRPAPPASARWWCRCSSTSRCWPPSSAAWTSKAASSRPAASACAPIAKPWWCPIRSSWLSCSSNSTRPAKPPNWPRRLCKNCKTACPSSTKRAANASSRSTMKARAKPSWPRACKPCARCKKK
jgi:energy-coupling factor transporter ATP-binding protein EcfA2